jgi:bifunctional DNase/RNase
VTEDEFKFGDDLPDDFLNNPFGDRPEDSVPEDGEEHEVSVAGVYEHRVRDEDHQSEFVVLVRDNKQRTVLIVIGRFEAMAISLALEGHSADRPLTHDLLNNVINKLGGVVSRILIDDLWNGTYYAKVTILAKGTEFVIDSRPSDAIALALRAKSPIYMAEHILRAVGLKEE